MQGDMQATQRTTHALLSLTETADGRLLARWETCTKKTTRRNIGFQRALRSQRPARGHRAGQAHGEIDIISQITKTDGMDKKKKISCVNLLQCVPSLCETDITRILKAGTLLTDITRGT